MIFIKKNFKKIKLKIINKMHKNNDNETLISYLDNRRSQNHHTLKYSKAFLSLLKKPDDEFSTNYSLNFRKPSSNQSERKIKKNFRDWEDDHIRSRNITSSKSTIFLTKPPNTPFSARKIFSRGENVDIIGFNNNIRERRYFQSSSNFYHDKVRTEKFFIPINTDEKKTKNETDLNNKEEEVQLSMENMRKILKPTNILGQNEKITLKRTSNNSNNFDHYLKNIKKNENAIVAKPQEYFTF